GCRRFEAIRTTLDAMRNAKGGTRDNMSSTQALRIACDCPATTPTNTIVTITKPTVIHSKRTALRIVSCCCSGSLSLRGWLCTSIPYFINYYHITQPHSAHKLPFVSYKLRTRL